MALYKAIEWQSESGMWKCGNQTNLGTGGNTWFLPARILGISPAQYIELLVKKYNAEVYYAEDFSHVGFSWQKQADMRKWKNRLNKASREYNHGEGFQI